MKIKSLLVTLGALLIFHQSFAQEDCATVHFLAKDSPFLNKSAIDLGPTTNVDIYEGDLDVWEGNGRDGKAAFALPQVDPQNSGHSKYSVYFRSQGSRGSQFELRSCLLHPTAGLLCSQKLIRRQSDSKEFQNVTAEALYIYNDLYGVGFANRFALNADQSYKYFWQIRTSGKVDAELKFCPGESIAP